MNKSLYSILSPLISQRKNGKLSLFHDDGRTGAITMQDGSLLAISSGSQQGLQAGRQLAMWLRFDYEFDEVSEDYAINIAGSESDEFLKYLLSVEKKSSDIQKVVTFDGTKYKFLVQDLQGNKEFKPNELKVAMALDGKTTIEEIAKSTGIEDLLVLAYIFKLNKLGLLRKSAGGEVLLEDQETFFVTSIAEILAEFLGPAAELIIDDAFEGLQSSKGMIYKNELPQIIANLSDHLEGDDCLEFKKGAMKCIKEV